MSEESTVIDSYDVLIRRKRVKNLSLYIKPPDGHIEITAPSRMAKRDIESFVREKRRWIESKRRSILESPQRNAEEASEEEIQEWYEMLRAFTPPLIEKWERIIGVKAGPIAYRNMKTRWGSCKPSTGRICLNVRLALYPPDCLEYVVVHELCHLIERGHGERFYELMDTYLPHWRSSRAKLR